MDRTFRLVVVATAVCLAGAGCMEANPLPSPGADVSGGQVDFDDDYADPDHPGAKTASISGALTFVSALDAEDERGTVVVTGLEGAVFGARVRLDIPDLDVRAFLAVDPRGSFGTILQDAYEGLEIVLTAVPLESDGADAEPAHASVTLVVRQLTGDEPDVPWFNDRASEDDPATDGDNEAGGAQPPGFACGDSLELQVTLDAGGIARVYGPVCGVTPNSRVVVFNARTNESRVTSAVNDGSFTVAIEARSGDRLLVFAANPSDPELTTAAVELAVP